MQNHLAGNCIIIRTMPEKKLTLLLNCRTVAGQLFEIKLGANQIESAARELVALSDAIAKEKKTGYHPLFLCVICGMSNAAYRREDGVFVVPITALKKI
ncbi:MAG: hypothetical protein L6V93_01730 [Clostridiales bacterium]|nr:MAG: hypothetical protein L6V93_01730 [Clostridiales bacterium]